MVYISNTCLPITGTEIGAETENRYYKNCFPLQRQIALGREGMPECQKCCLLQNQKVLQMYMRAHSIEPFTPLQPAIQIAGFLLSFILL